MNRIAWALVSATALALPGVAPAAGVKEVRKTVDLAGNGRLSIDTFKGSIEVSAWDRPQAEIAARIEPDDSDFDGDQARKVRETEVRIDGSGGSVRVKSDYSRVRGHLFWIFGGGGTLPFVRYSIRMPRTATLQIKDYKSTTRIADLGGPLEIETYKGEVNLREIAGPVRLHTYKGEVHAAYARFAKSDFRTHKGSIEIAVPRQAAFSLDADVGRRGELVSDFGGVSRASGRAREERYRDAAVNGGGPTLSLRTYRGELRLRAR